MNQVTFLHIYSRILLPTWTQPDLLSLLLGCGLGLYHLNLGHQESANFAIFLPPFSLYNLFHICPTSPLVKGHSASINKYTRWELQQNGELTPSIEGLPSYPWWLLLYQQSDQCFQICKCAKDIRNRILK